MSYSKLLEQRGADALRGAAAHMAVDRHRVDHGAAIVHGDIVQEAHLPGLGIHLDHRHVAHVAHDRIENAEIAVALGQRRQRMVVGVARVETTGQIRIVGQRQTEEVRLRGDLGDRHFQSGCALDADLAVAEFEIVGARFEHVARHALELFLDDRSSAGNGAGRPSPCSGCRPARFREGRDRCPNRSR